MSLVKDTVALGQIFFRELRFSPALIIPPLLHAHISLELYSLTKCRQGGEWGDRYKISAADNPERSPRPGYVVNALLSLSAVSLFVDLQINHIRPSPSHSATDMQSHRLGAKMFSPSALAGEPEFFFYLGPNPLSVGLVFSY